MEEEGVEEELSLVRSGQSQSQVARKEGMRVKSLSARVLHVEEGKLLRIPEREQGGTTQQ